MATLSLADSFFYEELQAALSHRQANVWLKRTLAKVNTSSSESTRCATTARSVSPHLLRHHTPSSSLLTHAPQKDASVAVPIVCGTSVATSSDALAHVSIRPSMSSPTDPVLPWRSASDGKAEAQRAASDPSSSVTVKRAKPLALPAPADTFAEGEDSQRLKHVLRTAGRNAGLIFTDAAHCVFDLYVDDSVHIWR
jgi:hypothetical protein